MVLKERTSSKLLSAFAIFLTSIGANLGFVE